MASSVRLTAIVCPRCGGAGVIGDRYCADPETGRFCAAADDLRVRVETAPELAEFRRKRDEVERMLRNIETFDHWRESGCPDGEILHPDETDSEVN